MQFSYDMLNLYLYVLTFISLVIFVSFFFFWIPTFVQALKGMKSQIISDASNLENAVESHGFGRKRCLRHKILLESSPMLVK